MLPSAAVLRACLVECPQLWRRQQRVGTACGISVSAFNALAPPCTEARSYQLWQFGHTALSAGCGWGVLGLPAAARNGGALVEGTVRARATQRGTCHAVAAWIDFRYAAGRDDDADDAAGGLRVRTGPLSAAEEGALFQPTPWAQALLFLPEPAEVGRGEDVEVRLKLDLLRGGALSGGLVSSAKFPEERSHST